MAALASAAVLFLAACEQENTYVAPPPPKVSVAVPLQQDVTEYLEFTGTTAAAAYVEVRARVPGVLDSVLFDPGTPVRKGETLFDIDPSEYEADLQAAEADLAVVQAELDQATTELDRSERLVKKGAIAETVVVEWQTKQNVAKAQIKQAQAKVDRANLNLGYTKIEAPIDGRVGRNAVDPGNLVGEGEATLLTAITDYDPMYVYFNLNELDLLRVLKMFKAKVKEANLGADGTSNAQRANIPLGLRLADEQGYPHEGITDYGESGVDPQTGTLQVRGVFDNKGNPPAILPGLFARIRMPVQIRKDALLVTEKAVGADQGGRYLLVVTDDGQVEKRAVRTGQRQDGLIIIEEGLKPGERVVVRGIQRARPGAPVNAEEIEMATLTTSASRAAAEAESGTSSDAAPAKTEEDGAAKDAEGGTADTAESPADSTEDAAASTTGD
jgi:RND family efflux transporter MFP subunit